MIKEYRKQRSRQRYVNLRNRIRFLGRWFFPVQRNCLCYGNDIVALQQRLQFKELLNNMQEEESVLVNGWVRTRRDSKGGFSFLEINDGSCQANIQAIVEHSLKEFAGVDKKITTGSCIAIYGQLVASEGKGQKMEIQATAIEVYGSADVETYLGWRNF